MTAPVLLVPADPLDLRASDQHFSREADVARQSGPDVMVIDHDAVVAGDDRLAVRRVAASDGDRPAWYQGWMLPSRAYGRLATVLETRGVRLCTGPAAYRKAHELPGWYAAFAGVTPRSVWMPWTAGRTPTAGDVGALVAELGGGPRGARPGDADDDGPGTVEALARPVGRCPAGRGAGAARPHAAGGRRWSGADALCG